MNNYDTIHTDEEYDLHQLEGLRKAIDLLVHLEQTEDEDSVSLNDARTAVRRRVKGLAIDIGIYKEFINGIQ